ncbi:hypothetical protein HDU76_005099, partial [Blyttiomyces sp. JEL0837]
MLMDIGNPSFGPLIEEAATEGKGEIYANESVDSVFAQEGKTYLFNDSKFMTETVVRPEQTQPPSQGHNGYQSHNALETSVAPSITDIIFDDSDLSSIPSSDSSPSGASTPISSTNNNSIRSSPRRRQAQNLNGTLSAPSQQHSHPRSENGIKKTGRGRKRKIHSAGASSASSFSPAASVSTATAQRPRRHSFNPDKSLLPADGIGNIPKAAAVPTKKAAKRVKRNETAGVAPNVPLLYNPFRDDEGGETNSSGMELKDYEALVEDINLIRSGKARLNTDSPYINDGVDFAHSNLFEKGLQLPNAAIAPQQSQSSLNYSGNIINPTLGGDEKLVAQNDDFCAACLGRGQLLCCDSCPRVFHFGCVEEGFDHNDVIGGNWECKKCRYLKNNPNYSVKINKKPKSIATKLKSSKWGSGSILFGELLEKLEAMNPRVFELPRDIREAYEDVMAHPLTGDYIDIRETEISATLPQVGRPPKLTKAPLVSPLNFGPIDGCSNDKLDASCVILGSAPGSNCPPIVLPRRKDILTPSIVSGTVADWVFDPVVSGMTSFNSRKEPMFPPACYHCQKAGPRLSQLTLLETHAVKAAHPINPTPFDESREATNNDLASCLFETSFTEPQNPTLHVSTTKMELIRCDYCGLWWHLDCLKPPICHVPPEIAATSNVSASTAAIGTTRTTASPNRAKDLGQSRVSAGGVGSASSSVLNSPSTTSIPTKNCVFYGSGETEIIDVRQVRDMRTRSWGKYFGGEGYGYSSWMVMNGGQSHSNRGIGLMEQFNSPSYDTQSTASGPVGIIYLRRRWMCPCHADWVLPKKRKHRGYENIDETSNNEDVLVEPTASATTYPTPNDGHIDIVFDMNSPSTPSLSGDNDEYQAKSRKRKVGPGKFVHKMLNASSET